MNNLALKKPLTWIARRSGSRSWSLGLIVLFTATIIGGLLGRVTSSKKQYWGADLEAILCGARRVNSGQSLYPDPADFNCAGMEAASYVYPPGPAYAVSWLSEFISFDVIRIIYAALFFFGLALTLIIPLTLRALRGYKLERLAFWGFGNAKMFFWANIAGILYGVITIAALMAPRLPLVFTLLVALTGMIKPTYLVFLIVVLLMDMAIIKRLGLFVVGCLIGGAPTLYSLIYQPDLSAEWMQLAKTMSYDMFPGNGFFGWAAFSGLPADSAFIKPLYLMYASVLGLAGFGACERLFHAAPQKRAEIVWFALAIGVLLNPRLFAYDCLLLAPGLISLIYAAKDSPRHMAGKPLYKIVSMLVVSGAIFALFTNLVGLDKHFDLIPTAIFVTAIIVSGLPELLPAIKARQEWLVLIDRFRRKSYSHD